MTVATIRYGLDKIAKGDEGEKIRNERLNEILDYSNLYKSNVYPSVMRDLTLLPYGCYYAVNIYYTFAEQWYREALRELQTKDLRFLKSATKLLSDVSNFGVDALSNLYSVSKGITVNEGERLVRKALMDLKKYMK